MTYRGDYDAEHFDATGTGIEPPSTEATHNYAPGADAAAVIGATLAAVIAGTDPGTGIEPIPSAPAAIGATVYLYLATGDDTAGIRFEHEPAEITPRADMQAAWLAETGQDAGTGPDWPRNVAGYKLVPNPPPYVPPEPARTRPQPPPYSAGDWWRVTGAGTVYGAPVQVGDRLYPYAVGRFYGEETYGAAEYGGEPLPAPWPDDHERTRWYIEDLSEAPAWDTPPGPFTGCKFGNTGWNIVLEAFYSIEPARRYGSNNYGTAEYGGALVSVAWQDITQRGYGIVIRTGGADGAPVVDVDEGTFEFSDIDARIFPMFPAVSSGDVDYPTVGTPIRLSLVDPEFTPYPIYTGRIETAGNDHNEDSRAVVAESFGMVADLAVLGAWDYPAQDATDRLAALVALAGYSWGTTDPPATPAPLQRTGPQTGQIREEIDTVAISAGLSMDSDAAGRIRLQRWPIEPAPVPTIETTDKKNQNALPVNSARLVADSLELLNTGNVQRAGVAAIEDDDGNVIVPEIIEHTYTATDALSVEKFGRRDEVLGAPFTGLQCTEAGADALAEAAVNRYGRTMQRIESIEVDTLTDSRWLPVLAQLDRGTPLRFTRTAPARLTLDAIVIGTELRITPGRVQATIYLTTTTETRL